MFDFCSKHMSLESTVLNCWLITSSCWRISTRSFWCLFPAHLFGTRHMRMTCVNCFGVVLMIGGTGGKTWARSPCRG